LSQEKCLKLYRRKKSGANFKRRTWNSNNTSKKVVWQCRTYVNEVKEACDAKVVDEYVLQDAFVRIFNRMHENKDGFIRTLNANIAAILSKREGHEALTKVEQNIEQLKADLKGLVNLKLRDNIDETVYNEENSRISQELDELRKKKIHIEKDMDQKTQVTQRVNEIIKVMNTRQDLLEQFDDELFNALVEKITILSPTSYLFTLKSGMEIEEYEE
jgi:site-specific DNA recombinase